MQIIPKNIVLILLVGVAAYLMFGDQALSTEPEQCSGTSTPPAIEKKRDKQGSILVV